MLDLKDTFNFSQAALMKPLHCKNSHWLPESAFISQFNPFKQQSGFYQISPYLADIILRENNTKK